MGDRELRRASAIGVESPRARRTVWIVLVVLVSVFAVATLLVIGIALGISAAKVFGAEIERDVFEGTETASPGIVVGAVVGGVAGALAGVGVAVWVARLMAREFRVGEDRV